MVVQDFLKSWTGLVTFHVTCLLNAHTRHKEKFIARCPGVVEKGRHVTT